MSEPDNQNQVERKMPRWEAYSKEEYEMWENLQPKGNWN